MSNVQSGTAVGGIISGQTVAIVGVLANDGLGLWLFFDTAVTSATISDSIGTTWAVNGAFVQNVANGESEAIFTPTSAVGAGTHTLTVTFPGGGNAIPTWVEDTNSTYGVTVGRNISSPGTGQTLTPGAPVGNSGDVVYVGAFDAAGGSTAQQPVAGSGGGSILQTGNNAAIGSLTLAYFATGGGTTPSLSPGTAGATDETGVLALNFIGTAPSPTATIAWIT